MSSDPEPLLLVPLESTAELPEVPMSPVADEPTPGELVSPPEELEPLAPWFAPADWPVELLPEPDPEMLEPDVDPDWPVPAEPDEPGV